MNHRLSYRPSAALRLLPLLLLTAVLGCDGLVDARGRVVGADGSPIAGAQVNLGRPGETLAYDAETDANGCFAAGGMVSPGVRDYDLTVSAPGYLPYELTFENSAELALVVELATEDSGGESTAERFADSWPTELEGCGF